MLKTAIFSNFKYFKYTFILFYFFSIFIFSSCQKQTPANDILSDKQKQTVLLEILQNQELSQISRFTIVNQIASNYKAQNEKNEFILFLSDYVEKHPDDTYNSYWLLMLANEYMEQKAYPFAEYYFERILNNYDDLLVKGESVHYICLTNLLKLDQSASKHITYYNQLIQRFPEKISLTECYARLATEYEKLGEWEQMLKAYALFEAQNDAATIQIAGLPNAYNRAHQMLRITSSAKNWSFESLEALEKAIKTAISNHNYTQLDRYKSRSNFFAVSWRQDENDTNSQANFSLSSVMKGRIRYSETLDETTNSNEAYLRTWGWQQNVSVWYFCFRKINFPLDPEIHGRWEWAGIYYGERL